MQQSDLALALLLGSFIAITQAAIIVMVARRRISLSLGVVLTLAAISLAVAVWTVTKKESLFVAACMSLMLGIPAAIVMVIWQNLFSRRKSQHLRD